MRFHPQLPRAHRIDALVSSSISPATACAARIVTFSFLFLCMLWLGVRVYSTVAHAVLRPVGEDLSPGVELAWSNGAVDGQIVSSAGDIKINVEAYNKKREKDIADASGKLLTLAIALREELERDPSAQGSRNTVRKADEIRKLAHDVKEMMKINMAGPY